MNAHGHLLSDEQMQQFLRDGFVTVRLDVPDTFHQYIRSQMDDLLAHEPNPGNNLLPRIPEIRRVLEDPTVRGALMSLLGEDYYMQPHRHPHYNHPQSEGQKMHQDGGRRWSHRTRRLLVFYYPQDTPMEIGPTGIVPGSHYYCTKVLSILTIPEHMMPFQARLIVTPDRVTFDCCGQSTPTSAVP